MPFTTLTMGCSCLDQESAAHEYQSPRIIFFMLPVRRSTKLDNTGTIRHVPPPASSCFRDVRDNRPPPITPPPHTPSAHLFVVADLLDQLLQGHLLPVLVEVPLRRHPGMVHQEVRIGREARHHARRVLVQP